MSCADAKPSGFSDAGTAEATDRGLSSITLSLKGGHLIGLEDACGAMLHLVSGQLWITQSGDYRDIIVEPGQSVRLDRAGLALITAILASALVIIPDKRSTLDRLRFNRKIKSPMRSEEQMRRRSCHWFAST